MQNPELHLFIIWQNARFKSEEIIEDIRKKFEIVQVFNVTWSPKMVSSNFTRFYGVSLPNKSFKEKECGVGEFKLIVVYDHNPFHEIRMTSHGKELVNVNMFEAKYLYRSWTGGGHKIHGTTNELETNNNLTLLLGLNAKDFIKKYNQSNQSDVITLCRDLEGAHGWDSLKQLFYILNSTVPYVILRGEKEINTGIFPDNHRDVDILLENKDYQNAKYIINGFSCCNLHRPHELVKINGDNYYIDIWQREKNYFDRSWCTKMLLDRQINNGLYVLPTEHKFYTLLYHCFFIKGRFEEDYIVELNYLREHLNLGTIAFDRLLLQFLSRNDYVVIRPTDLSIELHFDNELLRDYALKYGVCISSTVSECRDVMSDEQIEWKSRVYDNGPTIIKEMTKNIAKAECCALRKLSNYQTFPQIIRTFSENGLEYIEMTKVNGINVEEYFLKRKNRTFEKYKSFIIQAIDILEIMYKEQILHRDFISQNILAYDDGDNMKLNCIDFGWSIDYKLEKSFICPVGLAGKYSEDSIFSDFITLSSVIKTLLCIPYTKRIIVVLSRVKYSDYADEKKIYEVFAYVRKLINHRLTLIDRYLLFRNRYAKIDMLVNKIRAKSPDFLWNTLRKLK